MKSKIAERILSETPDEVKQKVKAYAEQTYRDHKIEPVFHYTNGKSDWTVYPVDGESGWIEPSQTLEQVKKAIDEKLS